MAIFSDEDILTILRDQNPWWRTGEMDPLLEKAFHRGEYYEAKRILFHSIRRFPVLSGLRRVGKSSILYQIIGDLLREGISPTKIIYISLDTSVLSEAGLLRTLHVVRAAISSDPDFYLFADEVQKDSDWTSVMKHVYDTFPACRAIATGSASGRIEDTLHETAEGRLHLIKVPTLSFYEYCQLKGISVSGINIDNLFQLHSMPLSEQSSMLIRLSPLYAEMLNYLRVGGFPEFVRTSPRDENYVLSLIAEGIINKAIYVDLSDEKVNATQLRRLFVYLCNTTSNQFNVQETCNQLNGISPITVEKYLTILENANLIYRSWPVKQDGKKALKAQAKIYIADAGVREAIITGLHTQDDPVQLGYMVESAAYKHTVDYCRAADYTMHVGYLRNSAAGGSGNEVDIAICNRHGIIQLVESKFRTQSPVRKKDMIITAAIPDTVGYVITKGVDDYGLSALEDTSIYRIPACAYLFLMGRMQYQCYAH